MGKFWIGDNNGKILEKQEKEVLYCAHCNCEMSSDETYAMNNGDIVCGKCFIEWFESPI